MRYVLLVGLGGLGLGLILFALVATPDAPLAAGDPHDAAPLLAVADTYLRDVSTAASELLRDLVDGFTTPYRERLQRTLPTEPLPR
jgi:hypothetical protein